MSHDLTKNTQIQINNNGNTLNVGPTGALNVSAGGTITVEDGIGAKAGTGVTAVELMPIMHHTRITLDDLVVATTDAGAAGAQGSQKLYDFPQGLIEIVGCIVNLTTETVPAAEIGATAALVGSIGTVAAVNDNATLLGTEADIHPSIAGTLVANAGTLIGKSLPLTGAMGSIAALTDSSVGTAGDTIAALPVLTDSPATADALRDDLNTNAWPVLRNWIASVSAKVNALLASRRLFDGTSVAKDAILNIAIPNADSSANSTVTLNGTVDLLWINHGDV